MIPLDAGVSHHRTVEFGGGGGVEDDAADGRVHPVALVFGDDVRLVSIEEDVGGEAAEDLRFRLRNRAGEGLGADARSVLGDENVVAVGRRRSDGDERLGAVGVHPREDGVVLAVEVEADRRLPVDIGHRERFADKAGLGAGDDRLVGAGRKAVGRAFDQR